jgi:hypothetical protein
MWFYSLDFILLIVFAIFYFRAGESEGSSGIVWSAASIAISMVIWRIFGWGWFGILIGQIALFVGITIIRIIRKP